MRVNSLARPGTGGPQPGVDRLGLRGQDGEHALVHPPQRLPPGGPLQRLQPERVLAEGQAALSAEVAGAQPVEVLRPGVVRAVDDPQVLPPADLQPRLHQPAPAADEVGRRLDHHALTAGGGQLGPPVGGRLLGRRIGDVDVPAGGRPHQLRIGVGQPVGQRQVPGVPAVGEARTAAASPWNGAIETPVSPSVGQQ
jgi:hypothetical protein